MKEVNYLLKEFRRLVNDVLIDPPQGTEVTQKTRLKDIQDTLRKEVTDFRAAMKAKAADLLHQDKLNNKKIKEEAAKRSKLKKAQIDIDNLIFMLEEL